jgi:hypothetical protein
MSYRYEKNLNGQHDLILDGWEKGIASSPFKGVANIQNMNVKYYEGVAYGNYKRLPATINGGTMGKPLYSTKSPAGLIYISDDNQQIWKQDSVNGTSFTILTGNFAQSIGGIHFWNNYLLVMGEDSSGRMEICGDGSGDAGVTSSNWNTPLSTVTVTISIASPAVITASNHGLLVGQPIRFATTGALPTGITANTNYYVSSAGLTDGSFQISTNYTNAVAGTSINTSGTQSGTQTYQALAGGWPIRNNTSGSFVTALAAGATTGIINTVPDSNNIGRGVWGMPTGAYVFRIDLVGGTQQYVVANVEWGSPNVSFFPPLNKPTINTATFVAYWNGNVGQSDVQHMSITAANDGNMYFTNAANLGALTLNLNQIFSKNEPASSTFYANILSLPPTETAVWITELKNQLIVMTKFRLYGWDLFSQYYSNPVPMDEQITKGINILNKLYIWAGNKGNIYQSDGYSVARYAKMPDYLTGATIDPAWTVGGLMQHRQKPYFQMTAKNGQTGTNIVSGIFSLDLDTGALVMENQFSGGLNPAGMTGGGLLIDNPSLSVNYDNYYSAYGATSSVVEYNDTTLYSSNEAAIETDIVPIGTALQPKTYGSAEFKLDRPLQSGDSISLYARKSLSDSYTLIGTTTTAVLSEGFQNIPFENWQWIQFKVTVSYNPTATSSSFVPIREIRIR